MAVVYLVRHGQASFGAADYDVLSELGARQSEVAGAELRRRAITPTVLRSGGLARQRDTAVSCLRAAGIDGEAKVDPRFDEYDHVELLARYSGDASFTRSSIDHALPAWAHDGADSPCAESWPEFMARSRAGLNDVLDECGRGGSAVVFTSGGVIAAICTGLLGGPVASFLAMNRVTVNCGITKIVHGRSGTSLLTFNDHAHFDGEHAELLSYR